MSEAITFALPSKGAIAQPTRDFLKMCGLSVSQPNSRQYTGSLPAIPDAQVLFQRVKDIVYKVADGTAQFGITGLDVVKENDHENLIIVHDHLGYGHCELMIAVPESWIDVQNIVDLAEVALDFRENKERNLRIATTFVNQTRRFLHQQDIHHFTLVKADGAIEAAPTIGYADIVVDLSQTGTTLRENHLKIIDGGTILESQACLIANQSALQNPNVLDKLRVILEYIDAGIQGKQYFQVNLNIQGTDAADVARRIAQNPMARGLLGPTVAPIHSANIAADDASCWFAVTISIGDQNLLETVEYLRSIGAVQVIVSPVHYVFMAESPTYAALLKVIR